MSENGDRSELPDGWEQKTLGDLCGKPQYGYTTKAAPEGSLKFLRTTDITRGPIDWEEVPFCATDPEDAGKYLLRDGDIVISRSGSVGVSALVKDPPSGAFASYLIRFRPKEEMVAPIFLAWYLRSPAYWLEVRQRASGIGMNNINAKKLSAIPIPVPPIRAQRAIAQKVEARMAAMDAGDVGISAARGCLKALRRSLLASLISESWPRVPLMDALVQMRNGIFVSRPATDPPGIPILRISAVRPMEFDATDRRYAPADLNPDEKYFVEDGDLLFTRYSGNPNYVGACALVEGLREPVLHPDKLIRAVVDRSKAEPAFLALACSVGKTLGEIVERRKTTAGQVGIASGQLKTVSVPLPPLDVQREVVAAVAKQHDSIAAVEGHLAAAETRSVSLRRLVLSEAFAPRDAGGHSSSGRRAHMR